MKSSSTTHRLPTRTRWHRLVGLTLSAALLALVGCAGGAPEARRDQVQVKEITKQRRAIYLLRPGGADSNRHIGYLTEVLMQDRDQEIRAYQVFDRRFDPLGFYYDDGTTYVQEGSDSRKIGVFDRNQALEQLFGQKGTFSIADLPKRI